MMKSREDELKPAAADLGMREGDELQLYKDMREARLKKRARRKKRIVVAALILLAVVCVILNWDRLAPATLADTIQSYFTGLGTGKFPIVYPSGEFRDATPVGDNFAVLTDTSLIFYSRSGAQLALRQHGMSDPQIASGGGRAVIYDRGGKQFRVETRFDETYTGSSDYGIVSAAASPTGEFALVSESDQYLGELTVYDLSVKSVFRWQCTEGRILSAALSPDGKSVAAIVLGAKNGVYTSVVYLFRLDRPKPVAVKSYDGTMLFSIQYESDGTIAAVGDNRTVFLSDSGTVSGAGEYDYANGMLSCYTNSGGVTTLALASYLQSGKTQIVSLDRVGKPRGSLSLDETVNALSGSGDTLVALTADHVSYCDPACKKNGSIEVTGDKIKAIPIKGRLYVFGLLAAYQYSPKTK